MQAAEHPNPEAHAQQADSTTWTYPTRFCRICREDVPATVTMYPPGLPMQFQTPIVEYRNDDEYGRLIKPCHCRGSLRYIHELCLLRSRTENRRVGSMWKCHECGHQFNFKRLAIQRYISSWYTVSVLTVLFMSCVVFMLGFVADPIINIYLDPYESLIGEESIWDELEVRAVMESPVSQWSQHFAKGFISMGLVGFLKTLFFNPFQWVNLRFGGSLSSTRGTTGRNRAANISWIAIVIGVCSAFAFFYKFVQAIIQRSLQRIGNNIVDTQLPGDDDDLKPPPGWKHNFPREPPRSAAQQQTSATNSAAESIKDELQQTQKSSETSPSYSSAGKEAANDRPNEVRQSSGTQDIPVPLMSGSWVDVDGNDDDALSGVHRQGWSFSNL
ncbi:hypothetical protein LTR70_002235 [Exophiala xenobiotica]|uniref:RING-CH-type domain-containing protein n=1 Tax=Lithohypha guttulata TaxID=1690604 RepID=A0ABR0KLE0_9EURO|nr:hypothetical protein LTR24_001343 [Lithohypha guttulata]KAK5325970.1 hypothetical protein LTR70_002235 [Exophiala xenobiotica]